MPTMRDRLREMEWRHATGVEDRETDPDEERVVRDDDEGVVGPDKEVSRRTAAEVRSSESDDGDVEKMSTEDEEELWRRVERDGFPREDTEVYTTTAEERYGRTSDTTRRSWVSTTFTRRR